MILRLVLLPNYFRAIHYFQKSLQKIYKCKTVIKKGLIHQYLLNIFLSVVLKKDSKRNLLMMRSYTAESFTPVFLNWLPACKLEAAHVSPNWQRLTTLLCPYKGMRKQSSVQTQKEQWNEQGKQDFSNIWFKKKTLKQLQYFEIL